MRKTIFTAFSILAMPLFLKAESYYDYSSLKSALLNGVEVRLAVYYGDCLLMIDGQPTQESPDAIGGMEVETFEIFSKGVFENEYEYLSFSESSLILLRDRHVINYVKFRVSENDSVFVRAQYLDPVNYEVLMDEEFLTMIRDEKGEGAAHFFSVH